MPLRNDYIQAVPIERGLFAVQLSDSGWSVADGPGIQMVSMSNLPAAGFHVPVRFDSREQAERAIITGPHEDFSTSRGSAWVKHCLSAGGAYEADYEQRRGPSDLSQRSG
ncbi:hypothetical protein SAMN05216421_0924 [Halopseudomonas xinjiangensis]|uniref:Uncharacterized protein n=1 Tax=Halopseudomonas xinjiangensis TaxID=487184 RepID=A0A1H1PIA7_9GAMM|nr:hypothetical protein [Halopseudomonas xinjiangensis]SDS11008.1 hypothetical protein SAMN05216421_0924 [Halopseudomonas xinjiangensis]